MIRGRIIYIVAFTAIVLSLIIAGCLSAPEGTPTPVVTPVMTPTATPTPAPTPATSVVVLTAPSTAAAGQGFAVSWQVNNPTQVNIPHTAVHYGQISKSEPLTLQSYPNLTKPQNGTIPAEFSTNIVINSAGITYFRAHAIIDGANYWSDERMITITAPSNVTVKVTPTATAPSGYGS